MVWNYGEGQTLPIENCRPDCAGDISFPNEITIMKPETTLLANWQIWLIPFSGTDGARGPTSTYEHALPKTTKNYLKIFQNCVENLSNYTGWKKPQPGCPINCSKFRLAFEAASFYGPRYLSPKGSYNMSVWRSLEETDGRLTVKPHQSQDTNSIVFRLCTAEYRKNFSAIF